jgi:hypothetical protein
MPANEQYAHVLLFACPRCGNPVTTSCTSTKKNLEIAEARWHRPHCHCGWTGSLSGVTAIKHWVEPWSGNAPEAGEPGSCDEEMQGATNR